MVLPTASQHYHPPYGGGVREGTEDIRMSDRNGLYLRAQRSLVSALLFDGSDVNRALEFVSPDDFNDSALSEIMESIANVARRDDMVSEVTVSEDLEARGKLDSVGGVKTIYALRVQGERALMEGVITTYAAVVREFSSKNSIMRLLRDAEAMFQEDSGVTARDAIATLQGQLSNEVLKLTDDATTTEVSEYITSYEDILAERLQITEENSQYADGLQGIPSMVPSLDKYTGGFKGGEMIVVGARTGIGKSVFAVMQAVATAQTGKTCLFFSMEMNHAEIIDRIVANVSGVDQSRLKQGRVNPEEMKSVREAMKKLEDMNIIIDTDSATTLDSIRSKAQRQAQTSIGLDMIIIDYLQLMSMPGKYSNRQEEVAALSHQIKQLAASLNVPIMVLVQMNPKDERGKDGEEILPHHDDVRESRAISHDSNMFIILHRNTKTDNTADRTLIILSKNRGGAAGKIVACHSDLSVAMFREIKKEEDVTKDNLDAMDSDFEDFLGDGETLDGDIDPGDIDW